jgi:two-component system, OmpR family, response regulator ResD
MKRILIIEDNESYRKMLKIYLEKEGYEVHEADNGKSGSKKCFENKFDLVIMDLFLPEKDGVQAIHELKEFFLSKIKIIAMSGAAVSSGRTEFVLNQSEQHGADALLTKPFEIKELLDTIEKLTC